MRLTFHVRLRLDQRDPLAESRGFEPLRIPRFGADGVHALLALGRR